MDEILLLLLRKGADSRPVALTTTELGELSGMSQQNASRKLLALERGGFLERSREGLLLTRKAVDELADAYSALKAAFEGERFEIEGVISKGLGEGGYYVSLPGYLKQIAEKLGFDPYPGTLNIRIAASERWKRQRMMQKDPVTISGFKDKERTYGDIFAYRCTVEGRRCAVIIPIRTHHGPDVLELICPFNAKKKLGKGEGDRIRVVI
ncbi:MAG: DUF120 domain-containing protein [Candidatus Micrarchaeota archaeon]